MNNQNKKEIIDFLTSKFSEFKTINIDIPHLMGEIFHDIASCHSRSDLTWFREGYINKYFESNNVVSKFKNVCLHINNNEEGRYLCCDDDVLLRCRFIQTPDDCYNCNADYFSLGIDPPTEPCTICVEGKIQGYIKNYAMLYNNHGNAWFIFARTVGNDVITTFHMRALDYNLSSEETESLFNILCEEFIKEKYDSTNTYCRYHDNRDTGFVFSYSKFGDFVDSEYNDNYQSAVYFFEHMSDIAKDFEKTT